jgi:hypothetical protein
MQIDETIHVPTGAYAQDFERRIGWINHQAKRMKSPLRLELTKIGEDTRPVLVTRLVSADGRLERVTDYQPHLCTIYRIACEEPVIALPGGWRYVGYISAKQAKRDVNTGEVDAPSYTSLTADKRVSQEILRSAFNANGMMRCDHCNTFRNRRVGLVICDDAGETKVVGSACVKDYLGHDYKRVLAYYQWINTLTDLTQREKRNGEWYRVEERDFEAERKAEAAAEERRRARSYSMREIVGAIRAAMITQGFYAQYSGDSKTATSVAAQDLLRTGIALDGTDAEREAVDAIIAWSQRYMHCPYGPEDRVTLGEYEEWDRDYTMVRSYTLAKNPLVGTMLEGRVETVLTLRSRTEGKPNGFGPVEMPTTDYVLVDEAGGVHHWNTSSSPKLPSGPFKAKFSVKRGWIEGVVAHHAITRLLVAA